MMLRVVLCVISFISLLNCFYSQCPEICVCLGNFTDCKYSNLSVLPNGLDPNITILDISQNTIFVFPRDLNDFPRLKQLNFSHNKVATLDNGAFTNLGNLHDLDFSNNLFSDWLHVKANAFRGAKILTYLDLSNNPLGSLPKNKNLLQIDALRTLRLVNCSIGYFNTKIFLTLPHLEELYLSKNPIKYLEAEFASSNLKLLDLSECNLQHVGPTIFASLTSLHTIFLSHNPDLKTFDCDSSSVYDLDVSSCNLEAIPRGNLPSVRVANFHGNHFRSIPERSFQNYSKLEKLVLSYNAISSIDETAFSDLGNIKMLDLSQNTLSTLNSYLFESNKNLISLNLSRNYINKFPNFVSDSLEILDVSVCEIPSISSSSLRDLPSLRELRLSKNALSSLPELWASDSLKKLDVSLCRIKTVNNKTFKAMLYLTEVNLAGNRLTSATPECFDQLESVDISDNPWRCECSTQRLLYILLSRIGRNMIELYCQTPDNLEGLPWLTACQREFYPTTARGEMVWWYTAGLIVAILSLFLLIIVLRRMHLLKEKRARAAERERRMEEREALRRMQRRQAEMREESNRNAPDPRELQRPPSYTEALLMPKLDASHPSLAGSQHSLASKRSLHGSLQDVSRRSKQRRKRRRRRSNSCEGRRASRNIVDSQDSSDSERPQQVATLESDI